jgi:TonB family protein
VNVALVLFYTCYRLLFHKDTFWVARRIYLLLTCVIAFCYPFLSFVGWLESKEPVQVFIADYILMQEINISPSAPSSDIGAEQTCRIIYGVVTLFFLVRTVVQIGSICRRRMRGRKTELFNTTIIELSGKEAPFSFFNRIFLNPELYSENELKQILTHEQAHVRQMHSADVILCELLTACCWINPASWLLKREVRRNLEFLADNKVLADGFDPKTYQYHLLQLSYQDPGLKLTNKFNISPLKKRIIMMNLKKTSKISLLKYALIVPLAFALIVSSNAENLLSSVKENVLEKAASFRSVVRNEEPIYDVVDQMPEFPGGVEKLLEFLKENIKYPEEAIAREIEGPVVCRFVVGKDGTVGDIEVLKGVDPLLDEEAVRVIRLMPKWKPGMLKLKGEFVNVKYTLPVVFSHSKQKTSASATTSLESPVRNTSASVVHSVSATTSLESPVRNTSVSEVHSVSKSVTVVSSGNAVQNISASVVYSNGNPDQDTSSTSVHVHSNGKSKNPLVIVDGKPLLKHEDLEKIDPETIEKVEVIKNKDIPEIYKEYGDQTADGVIVVLTLKK